MIDMPTLAFAMCGSFCTFEKALAQLALLRKDWDMLPVMSETAYTTDTRFGTAESFHERIENICGRKIIHTIAEAEPIGPKRLADAVLVAPCTGNTAAKIANAVTDTAVTMAVKSALRRSGAAERSPCPLYCPSPQTMLSVRRAKTSVCL